MKSAPRRASAAHAFGSASLRSSRLATQRSYQVIAECAQPDTSIANVALTHNLNANLVHKWIRVHAQKTWHCKLPLFRSRPRRR